MPRVRYARPSSVEEVHELLRESGERARVFAGSTDLLTRQRGQYRDDEVLIDLKHVPGLREIEWTADGDLVIGAAVTMWQIYNDPKVVEAFPGLATAAENVGSLQIRCRATVGGNLCNASPCMDMAPPLLALGASLRIQGPSGERIQPLESFFLGVRVVNLQKDEFATAIVIPASSKRRRSAFDKIKRVRGHDLALVNAGGSFDPEGGVLRIAIGSCGITPVLSTPIEGIDPEQADPTEIGEKLAASTLEAICPIDDVRASAEYRRDMTALLCRRLAAQLLAPAE